MEVKPASQWDHGKLFRDNPYIFGQFLWTGIDYLGEAHPWPSRGFSSGLLNLAGFVKPRGYFRQSLWIKVPMIYLGTYPYNKDHQNLSIDAPSVWNYQDNDTIRVVCYTNCSSAQLILNGQKVGGEKNYNDTTGILYWDIPYQAGKLEVVGYNSGKEAAKYIIETSKRPYAIVAKTLNKVTSPGKGVTLIALQIVDEDGKSVFISDNDITCTTEGPVKLLGMEAGNLSDMGNYTDNMQRVYQGRMIVYIQSTGKKGKANITFTSPWLKSAKINLDLQ